MDTIQLEVLEDGTITIQTSDISQKNHLSADEFLDGIEEMMGGERKTEARKKPLSFALRARDRQLKTFQK